jgi:transglutaminase-like putative cysteine protease
MLIRIGYDIALKLHQPSPIVFLLRVHSSRESTVIAAENFRIEPELAVEDYLDAFGNRCGRVNAPAGIIRFLSHAVVRDSGQPDAYAPEAEEDGMAEIPTDTLSFILPSRYCEVDSGLLDFAWKRFATITPGRARVQAICDFVHSHLRFDYQMARSNRTAVDAFKERVGVCRDFTHLAITLCRCLNIPARYVTGYLGDIGVPPLPDPMDFSAWFEVYLGGRWYSFDARHNQPHALFAGIEKQDQRQASSTLRNEGGPAGPGYAERRDGTKSEDKHKTEYRVQRNRGAGDDQGRARGIERPEYRAGHRA